MSLQVFYTTKGLALAAKIAAGTKLTVTKVTAGSGTTVEKASALAQERQTLTVGTAQVRGQTATLPVTLAEVNAAASYTLTELGVYARDPDAGEILYQAIRLDEPRSITAGGENVCRFYLNQTIGKEGITVTCSPAGLLIDEDLEPLRTAVFAKTPAGKSVTLTPAELPDYLKALPRMLTENLTITLTAGTVTKDIELEGLYGGGHLWIKAAEGADVQFAKSFMVLRCKSVFFSGLKFVGGQVYNGAHFVAYESFVWMSGCSFDAESNPTENGFIATNGSRAFLENGAFTNCKTAAQAIGSSTVTLSNMSGSGNTVGNSVWNGGIILLFGSTPDTLGASANQKAGGLIVKGNGTLL